MGHGTIRISDTAHGTLQKMSRAEGKPMATLLDEAVEALRRQVPRPGRTGISHWVEHMMFKGTEKFPSALADRTIARDGGMRNAMTWIDWTAYYETLPADKIDFALQLEADRMRRALFTPKAVESERTVIISERQGNENEPLFRLSEELQAAAFRVHSYHHEVIGDMADLHTMQRDDLYRHYRSHYLPNNAVLAVAGDFEPEEMLRRISELFEPIPAGPEPEERVRPEPIQEGERRITLEGPGETTYIELAHHAPAAAEADFMPLTVLDSLTWPSSLNMFGGGLSNKTSRLYRCLVEGELAISVHGGLPVGASCVFTTKDFSRALTASRRTTFAYVSFPTLQL